MNIFFIGDELIGGKGDPRALGWTGRVAARTVASEMDFMFHSLAVPGETTGDMSARWDEEVVRRVKTRGQSAVVFGVGRNDVRNKVTPTMTRLNLATALDTSLNLGFRTMIVGPPPSLPAENTAVAELAAVCRESAERRDVPYVDMYGPLVAHDQWLTDMATGEDGTPGQAGYGLMAWLVLHSGWREWLDLPNEL